MHLRIKDWETRHVKRNTVLQIVMASVTLLILCILWTKADLHTHDKVRQQAVSIEANIASADIFDKDDKKLQTVYFTKEHIYQIKVYLEAEIYDNKDFVYFRLYDENFSCIYSEDFGCNLVARDGYIEATPDMDVVPGQTYYYEIIVPEKATFWWMYTVEMRLPVASVAELGLAENGPLYVDGIYRDDVALIADFDYGKPYQPWQWIAVSIAVVLCAVLLYVVCLYMFEKWEPYAEKITQYGRRALFVFAAVFAIILNVAVWAKNLFGNLTADKIVYTTGSIVGLLWLSAFLWIPKEKGKRQESQVMSQTWRNAIQILAFGCLFYALSLYVNADVEYLHTNQTRWMLICMGIALLAAKSEKLLYHKWNAIWIGISLIGSVIYCIQAEEGQPLYLAKLTSAVAVIWGLVVIQVWRTVSPQVWKKINKPYFFCWLAFIACTYICRYEKTWVFTASLPFVILLLYNLKAEEKKALLQNMAQGILCSFWMITFYNLCHRPYHYWLYYRYSGIFHTVACTGLYLAVVCGAAFALLLGKWKNKEKIAGVAMYELFTLVTAVNYVIFAMARTAMLAVAVNMFLVMLLSVYGYRKSFSRMCREGVLLVLCILLSFPFIYSVQRMVPAVINRPEYHRIESADREFAIHVGEPWDSDKYMTIERFVEMFTGRVSTSQESAAADTQGQDLLASLVTDHIQVQMQAEQSEDIVSEKADISNGRFDIFRLYLSKISWKGNPGTTLESGNGEIIAHAHNSYIMVAYNFGIAGGILFLLLCGWSLILSIKIFLRKGKKAGVYLVPFSLITIFGFTGITEWCFHPCFTPGYVFLFMIPLLMEKTETK